MTTELLGLHPSGVGNQQRPVVGHELLLQFHRTVGIDVLGVVGNKGLSNRLSDSVHLRGVSSTLHSDTDIEGRERFLPGDQNRLVDLEAENLRLDEVDGRTIDADKTTAFSGVGDSSRSFLFAECLDGLDC